jgi:hypothetical protein
MFVAHPNDVEAPAGQVYAHPDGISDDGRTWRERLVEYNREPGDNPLGLLPAYRLYSHPAYERLRRRVSPEDIYILSAGWGLIRGDFLTPDYDITFSGSAEPWKRRRSRDRFEDLKMLELDGADPLLFFGGKAYQPLFETLSHGYRGPRIAYYNSKDRPNIPGVELRRFETTARTNWHYQAVDALVQDELTL